MNKPAPITLLFWLMKIYATRLGKAHNDLISKKQLLTLLLHSTPKKGFNPEEEPL